VAFIVLPDWSFQKEIGLPLVVVDVPTSALSQRRLSEGFPTPPGPVCAKSTEPVTSNQQPEISKNLCIHLIISPFIVELNPEIIWLFSIVNLSG
jgi:hypothetical protein